jgi:hypothetical protein
VIGQKGQKKPDGYCQAEVDPHKKRVYITSGGHVENGHQETDGDKAKDVLGDFHAVDLLAVGCEGPRRAPGPTLIGLGLTVKRFSSVFGKKVSD